LTPISSTSGFLIGLVGGVLDLASGAGLLLGGMQQASMGSNDIARQNELLALGLFWLGVIVMITAVVSILSVGRGRRKLFSGLMIAYGVVMLLVGGSMAGGLVMMMSTPFYGYAMIIVGVLMIANGSIMSRAQMMM
jgi:hypothetical protein